LRVAAKKGESWLRPVLSDSTPEDAGLGLGQDEGRSKLVQEMLRHQNLKTTLEVYAKAVTEYKLEAQGMFLELLFRRRKAAEPDPVKNLEKTTTVTRLVQ
jgi:hypothetical protein